MNKSLTVRFLNKQIMNYIGKLNNENLETAKRFANKFKNDFMIQENKIYATPFIAERFLKKMKLL